MPSLPHIANARRRERYATEPAYKRKRTKACAAYHQEHAPKVRQRKKVHREQYPDKAFDKQLRWAFGITLADYTRLLKKQRGVCAICKRPQRHTSKNRLCVDHCHKTKKIRGLLCGHCNTAIGLLDDNLRLVKAALRYLVRSE